MKSFDLNYNIIGISILSICIIITMVSCSEFNYVTRNYNTTFVIDSIQAFEKELPQSVEKDNQGIYIFKTYSYDSILIAIERFKDTIKYLKTGESRYWFEDGKIKRIVNYNDNGLLDGKLLTYYQNGNTKREDLYNSDSLITGYCYDSLGNEIKHFKYYVQPEIDLNELHKCLVYPEYLRRQNIEEYLILKFLVDINGKIIKIEYDNNHSSGFVEEAIKCLLKIKIEPDFIDGKPIKCWIYTPFVFRLV